jgi:hypothetical protein
MKRYRAKRRDGDRPISKASNLTCELRQLLEMVKNNAAVDLRAVDASIWLVSPNGVLSEKNSLGYAKIIIVLAAPLSQVSKEHLFEPGSPPVI